MKLHPVLIDVPAESEFKDEVRIEGSLIGQVVDRKERGRAGEKWFSGIDRRQIGRDESRLPIVAMDDVRRAADAFGKLDDGAAEEREPLDVEIAVAVYVPAPEIFGVVNEVNRRAVHPIAPYSRVFHAAG